MDLRNPKRKEPGEPWRLSITLKAESFGVFFPMMEKGVWVRLQVGSSIKSLLCKQIGLSEDYVDERIQTCFLNGKPVDDLDAALVRDGSTVAFSAAMPGLLGATLRKGGYYSPLRASITHRETNKKVKQREGWVLVKLFNLLIKEMGPVFLKRGIWAGGEDLQRLINERSDLFGTVFLKATLNGEDLDKTKVYELEWPRERVFLVLKEA